MKNYPKITFIILLLSILSSICQVEKTDTLISIDIAANIQKIAIVNLSQFTDNISYIPLENKENLNLGYITNLDISKNRVLVTDRNFCLLYDKNGHFISKIGHKGRGPGEYNLITNVSFCQNGKIYLSDTENLYEFEIDGSFVKKYTKSLFINDSFYITSWLQIDEDLFFGHVPNTTGLIKYKALLSDKYGNIKKYYINHSLFERSKPIASTMENYANINKFKNVIFYKDLYNDTLFYLTDRFELIPKYFFHLGRFKESVSERKDFNITSFDRMSECIYLYDVFQTDNYLFLNCDFGNHFPAKRLTARPTPVPFATPIWYNTRRVLGIVDKRKKDLVFCKPSSSDNPLFTSGLYNDIDAGPRFFPRKQVNDSTMVMWITAEELIDHVSSDDFRNNVPKYPEKKKELEKLANSLKETDNPVLVLVSLKK